MPALSPVTVLEVLTVAAVVLEELQLPPVMASVRDMVAPAHTAPGPVMVPALGAGLTVTDAVVVAVPQLLVMV